MTTQIISANRLGDGIVVYMTASGGWDEGIALMKEGGRARLVIPAALGYGSAGAGSAIPPDAVLIFDLWLVDVG